MKRKILNSFLTFSILFGFATQLPVSATTNTTIDESQDTCAGGFTSDADEDECRGYVITSDWSEDINTAYLNINTHGAAVDANGNIYVTKSMDIDSNDLPSPQLLRINAADGTVDVIYTYSNGYPAYLVVVGNDGNVYTQNYCTDTNQYCFLKYNTTTESVSMIKLDTYYSSFTFTTNFVVDSTGNIYFASLVDSDISSVIAKVDPSATETILIGDTLVNSEGISIEFIDSSDNLFVSNTKPSALGNYKFALYQISKTTETTALNQATLALMPNPVFNYNTFQGYEFFLISEGVYGYSQRFNDDSYYVYDSNTDTLSTYNFTISDWSFFNTFSGGHSFKSLNSIYWSNGYNLNRMNAQGEAKPILDVDYTYANDIIYIDGIIEGNNDEVYIFVTEQDPNTSVKTSKFYKIEYLDLLDVSFTSDYTVEQEYPVTVNFTDTSVGSPTSWTWYFGDGAESNLQNPSHTYTFDGEFTVTLVASNGAGATGTHSITVYVLIPKPDANFTFASTNNPAAASEIQFFDQSTNNTGYWQWDFDNNGTIDSTQQNPKYTFAARGNYTVKLIASNAGGSDEITKVVNVAAGWSSWGQEITIDGDVYMTVHNNKLYQSVLRSGYVWSRINTNHTWGSWQQDNMQNSYGKVWQISFGNKLYQTIQTGGFVWTRTHDGTSWSSWVKSGGTTGDVYMVVANGKLYQTVLVNGYLWTRINNGTVWSEWVMSGHTDYNKVFMKEFNNVLYQTVQTGGFVWTRTHNGSSWSAWVKSGGTYGDVYMEVNSGKLYQTVIVNGYLWTRINNGTVWSAWVMSGYTNYNKVWMISFGGLMYQTVQTDGYVWTRTHDGSNWSAWVKSGATQGDVFMSKSNGILFQSVVSDGYSWTRLFVNGSWTTWTKSGQTTYDKVFMADYGGRLYQVIRNNGKLMMRNYRK